MSLLIQGEQLCALQSPLEAPQVRVSFYYAVFLARKCPLFFAPFNSSQCTRSEAKQIRPDIAFIKHHYYVNIHGHSNFTDTKKSNSLVLIAC